MPLSKQTIRSRKDNNLCERCGKPNLTGKKLCQKHLNQFAQKALKRRHKLKAAGKCQQCQVDIKDGAMLCDKCKKQSAETHHKSYLKRYSNRKSKKLCVDCGKPAALNRTECQDCLDKTAKIKKRQRLIFEKNNCCSVCGEKLSQHINGKRCQKCITKRNEWYQKSEYRNEYAQIRANNRKTIVEHYGGQCACCGETTLEFLAIDHPNNNGKQDRLIKGFGSSFYANLIRDNFPEGYRVLCHNCNFGRYINSGICPHRSIGNQ